MIRVAVIALAAVLLGHAAAAEERRPESVQGLSRIAGELYRDSELVKRTVDNLGRAGWDATSPQGPVPIAKKVTPGVDGTPEHIDYTFLIIHLFQRKEIERGDIDALLTKVVVGGTPGYDRIFIQAKPGELQ